MMCGRFKARLMALQNVRVPGPHRARLTMQCQLNLGLDASFMTFTATLMVPALERARLEKIIADGTAAVEDATTKLRALDTDVERKSASSET